MGTIRNGVREYEVTEQGDYIGRDEAASAEKMKPMGWRERLKLCRQVNMNLKAGRGDRAIAAVIEEVNSHIDNGGYVRKLDEIALEDELTYRLAGILEGGLCADTVEHLRGLTVEELSGVPGIKPVDIAKVFELMAKYGL